MRKTLAMLAFAFGLALPAGLAEARDGATHKPLHREHASHHHHDGRYHAMERMRRQHDMSRTYHDRRPRRRMRSM